MEFYFLFLTFIVFFIILVMILRHTDSDKIRAIGDAIGKISLWHFLFGSKK